MTLRATRLTVLVSVTVVLAIVAVVSLVMGSKVLAFDHPSVTISGALSGNQIIYNITISNPNAQAIGPIYLAAKIPTGSTFDQATATPAGATLVGVEGDNVVWVANSVAGSGSLGPFSYRINIVERPTGPAWAFLHWLQPEEGTHITDSVTYQSAEDAVKPRRGCPACHVGNYTLAHEAEARGGPNHPPVAADAKVDTCLTCHAAGTGARANIGVVAPIMLRDIVHPAHMFSTTFVDRYKGNCFTCHNVQGDGTFITLGDRLLVDLRGIPDNLPVTGLAPTGP